MENHLLLQKIKATAKSGFRFWKRPGQNYLALTLELKKACHKLLLLTSQARQVAT
jgi:hypothetical protein